MGELYIQINDFEQVCCACVRANTKTQTDARTHTHIHTESILVLDVHTCRLDAYGGGRVRVHRSGAGAMPNGCVHPCAVRQSRRGPGCCVVA